MNPLTWLVLAHWSVAGAVRPPSDYAAVVGADMAKRVGALNTARSYDEAIALAKRIERALPPMAGVAYEAGYAHNQLGHVDEALIQYGTAITLEPALAEARYDRGEIYLSLGRWTDARADFVQVVASRPSHWAGHFRLAHLAGVMGNAEAFERHLTEAIRHGFDLSVLIGDPGWRKFAQDPELGGALRKILILYGSEDLLREFGGSR